MITLFSKYGKIYPVCQDTFPDGTLHVSFPDDRIHAIEWRYESDAELFTLICIRKHYSDADMRLIMPYIPHARMDRVKNDEDVFTLKYFCEIINSLHFTTVEVRDAHSNVSLALLNNVYEDPIEDYVRDAINQSGAEALFFPDEGAMKRYSSESELPYAFGMKKRDWKTGKIEGLDIINTDNIVGKDVLIVDDICSRGGTFYHSAKALKEAGTKNIYLYVTHCENTILEGELLTSGLIEKVYTTNSIFTKEHEMIEVFEL
jgi:ribose-phosphate pyrophosphokinase